ncbi:GGDEF domain-containing protein [Acinetobacter celticus]|uniref:diguanylate cyclase n=1 Tax=Acinetobacter celticus TaxID=1891224 RepID=A0A1C3D0J2_9GAMM|nr:diguanylate cyclase [Acinetobacter celticus]ODA14566.1 diguanylate cyclase [Acinetobacter celticus]
MSALRSEHISHRLWLAMLIIVFSVVLMSLPLILNNYRDYQKSSEVLLEIQSLKMVAELVNKVSRERAPANNVMSSVWNEHFKSQEALEKYRKDVDIHIQQTIDVLNETGFELAAQELQQQFIPTLILGRQAVDDYVAVPSKHRKMQQLDGAISAMFKAWDKSHDVLQHVIEQSKGKNSIFSSNYTLIFLLADLRDQAGRAASNIMAAVTFNETVPNENLARSLQTQRQAQYLWELVHIVQPEQDKTPEFQVLHQRVKTEFLDQALPLINELINESLKGQSYRMIGPQLTEAMLNKFTSVIDLQNYILEYSVHSAQIEQEYARKELIYAILILLVSLFTILLTMIYAKKWVFEPLILAREQLFALAQFEDRSVQVNKRKQGANIFDAIGRVQKKLQQREALEFQLKHVAHSDSLTGVANRFALDEYIKMLENQSAQFQQSCLIIIDIDNFKQVNDSYGHITGDLVIQAVAESLKESVKTSDLLVRYGGDEFLVLIENISIATALKIAEKIRKSVAKSDVFQPENFERIQVSISAGVAVGAGSWMGLLAKADEALFRAKAKGKNTVSS